MLTIKILFTINSLERRKNYSFKTLFTIPVDLKIIIIIIEEAQVPAAVACAQTKLNSG